MTALYARVEDGLWVLYEDYAKELLKLYREMVEEFEGLYELHREEIKKDPTIDALFMEAINAFRQGISPEQAYWLIGELKEAVLNSEVVE